MNGSFWERVVEPLVSWSTPSCQEVTRLLSSSLEKPLPLWRRLQLQLHFLICVWCHRYGEQIRFLRLILQHFHQHAMDDSVQLSVAARERLSSKLRMGKTGA